MASQMKMEKQRETEKFVGCILSVKTKPGLLGEVKNLIGTVRDIDVESEEQAIILDDAMANGICLPDGYVLMSGQIADLTVIGRADELEGSTGSREDPSPPLIYGNIPASQPIGILQHNRVHNNLGNASDSSSSSTGSSSTGDDPCPKVLNISKGQPPKTQVSVGNVLLNSVCGSSNVIPTSTLPLNATVLPTGGPVQGRRHKIAKPKPRKAQPGMVYSHSISSSNTTTANIGNEFVGQNGRNKASKVSLGSLFGNPPQVNMTNNLKSSSVSLNYKETNSQLQVTSGSSVVSDFPKENILTQTFGSITSSSSLPLHGASLFNTLASAVTAASGTTSTTNTIVNAKEISIISGEKINMTQDELTLTGLGNKKNQYDGNKLGVLSQFLTGGIPKSADSRFLEQMVQNGRQPNNLQLLNQFDRSSRVKGAFGKQQRQGDNGETFGMAKAEMKEDFDFEESNAQFEKLPVSAMKPVKVQRDPHFTSEDTTHLAERMIESVQIKGSALNSKKFVTDTGIAIPAVDLPTRSKILNLSHDLGLTHSRMIEAMARAVVQTCVPLLGDTYRLSPEREEDRPWVLVCAGPHWQGAVGIAAARIMASLGVRTYVHSPKEELSVCAVEEKLYCLTREPFTRHINDLGRIRFELVIMAMDDHLVRALSLPLYSRWLNNASVVFVDPPLISSYRDPLELLCGKGNSAGTRVIVISPALPLAYSNETNVKFFLVNLGIPHEIFLKNDVIYKSPFGDKMVIQIFCSKTSAASKKSKVSTATTNISEAGTC